jgi:hypothetical protein
VIGFHPPAEADGHVFRWSSPLAMIEAPVPHGTVEARLDLLPEQGPTPRRSRSPSTGGSCRQTAAP